MTHLRDELGPELSRVLTGERESRTAHPARVRVTLDMPGMELASIEMYTLPRKGEALEYNELLYLIIDVIHHAGVRSDGVVATLRLGTL